MTASSQDPQAVPKRFPLSFTQEFFCSLDRGDDGGTFGSHFVIVAGLRIAGRLDTAALQGALDDVVARHELLRTIVVRDADPPCQEVYPPCPVRLEVRDLPAVTDRSRAVLAEELIIEMERAAMSPRHLPLLRAVLGRLDDRDSVLVLMTHHSASDGWSMEVIKRDLAAYYAARAGGRSAQLPDVRQYREYAAWQRATGDQQATDDLHGYWREKLCGARVFTMPADRPVPEVHTRPYSAHNYLIGADTISAAAALAADLRCSLFMVVLATFHVLAHEITGTTDASVRSFTTGRNEPEFHGTMGPFMNLVPFRTDISDCVSFRDVVIQTRETCLGAYAHEVSIGHIEHELPEFNNPHDDPRMAQFILGMFQPQYDEADMQLGDGSYEIRDRVLPQPEQPDIPNGMVWDMDVMPSGGMMGNVLFHLDEVDERTVLSWVADHSRILAAAVTDPDQEWKKL